MVTSPPQTLPHAIPVCANARLALLAVRRMGTYGLFDAPTANAFVNRFGTGFRRPLTLFRALMTEMAQTAQVTIAVAPCCCARMTASEDAVIESIARAGAAPDSARLLLVDLLGTRHVDAVLTSAAAVSAAFADLGRPFGRVG